MRRRRGQGTILLVNYFCLDVRRKNTNKTEKKHKQKKEKNTSLKIMVG